VTLEITTDTELKWCDPSRADAVNLDACCVRFEKLMQEAIPGWAVSEQIRALQAIANPQASWHGNQPLRYPQLDARNRINEFTDGKRANNVLLPPIEIKMQNMAPVLHTSGQVNAQSKSDNRMPLRNMHIPATPAENLTQLTVGLPRTGRHVECEVLPDRTKKGGLRFKVVNGTEDAVGVLYPQSRPVPQGKDIPGQKLILNVRVSASKGMQFEVVEES